MQTFSENNHFFIDKKARELYNSTQELGTQRNTKGGPQCRGVMSQATRSKRRAPAIGTKPSSRRTSTASPGSGKQSSRRKDRRSRSEPLAGCNPASGPRSPRHAAKHGGNQMGTITLTAPTGKLTCTAALDQAYQLALAKMPLSTHTRLEKALARVRAGEVFETDDHGWEVASQSEGGYPHNVSNAYECDCDWAHYNPKAYCTHGFAVMLVRKSL